MRNTLHRLASVTPGDGLGSQDQILYARMRRRHVPKPWTLRALTGTRLQGWAAAGGIMVGAAFFLGPWLWDEWQELLHKRFVPLDPSTMPVTSPDWWENEWRKMNVTWRLGESTDDFYEGPYRFVREMTGRDLTTAERFLETRPGGAASRWDPTRCVDNGSRGERSEKSSSISASSRAANGPQAVASTGGVSEDTYYGWWFWRRWTQSSVNGSSVSHTSGSQRTRRRVSVLVPLCGDSPITRTMAIQGYDVDAVDCSQTAIQSAVEKTERALPLHAYDRIRFHWRDFFVPELWEHDLHRSTYDVIYERQGMTSLNREQRPDYAFLLKRALKPDGVMYVEGCFRTGRVKGNKIRGPPYSLSRRELEHLFPEDDGYYVRCEEKNDAMSQLSRENRVLQRVPREMYVTPFHCVVFRAEAVNLAERDRFAADLAEGRTRTPVPL